MKFLTAPSSSFWVRALVGSALIVFSAGSAMAQYVPLNWTRPAWVTQSSTDATVDRCVFDPEFDISSRLRTNPNYILAYRSGKSGCGIWAPTKHQGTMSHRQGIQRIDRGGENYLLVSNSRPGNTLAGFEVIRMGSRFGATFGLGSGGVTPTRWPNCSDHIVAYRGLTGFNHSGGMDVSGNFLAVPFETKNDSRTAGFSITDLSDPENPVMGSLKTRSRGGSSTKNAGAVAMTRLNNGRYIVIVFGHDSNEYEVFVSATTTFSAAPSAWNSMSNGNTPSDFKSYQGVQFVNACDGMLYVAGTHKSGSKDWVDLFQVTFDSSQPLAYKPEFRKVANRNMTCSSSNTGGQRYCDFQAGAGVYSAADGRLYLYGVEHYDDAYPNSGYGVKVREFTD